VLIVKVRVASFENIFYIVKQMRIGGGVIKVEERAVLCSEIEKFNSQVEKKKWNRLFSWGAYSIYIVEHGWGERGENSI